MGPGRTWGVGEEQDAPGMPWRPPAWCTQPSNPPLLQGAGLGDARAATVGWLEAQGRDISQHEPGQEDRRLRWSQRNWAESRV